jgi:hypothetical protein
LVVAVALSGVATGAWERPLDSSEPFRPTQELAMAFEPPTRPCPAGLAGGVEAEPFEPTEAQARSATAGGGVAAANPAHNLAALSNAWLRPIGSNTFALGAIELNVRERTISFPAVVNMDAGLIEYLLVHTSGKTHESLLRTQVAPHQIQLALLLLGAKGAGTNAFPQTPSEPLPGDPVTIELLWTDQGQPKRIRAEEAIRDRRRRAPATRGPWVYTGSHIVEGRFVAELVGSIVAVMEDPDALINNPRLGREDDENWAIVPGVLPPLESPVQVVIKVESRPGRP